MRNKVKIDKIKIPKNSDIDSIHFRIPDVNFTLDDRVLNTQNVINLQI